MSHPFFNDFSTRIKLRHAGENLFSKYKNKKLFAIKTFRYFSTSVHNFFYFVFSHNKMCVALSEMMVLPTIVQNEMTIKPFCKCFLISLCHWVFSQHTRENVMLFYDTPLLIRNCDGEQCLLQQQKQESFTTA